MIRGGEEGFTLLEVIVAFAILALSFAALYRSLGGSLQNLERTDLRQRAIAQAEALLAEVPLIVPNDYRARSGETADGMRWAVTFAPLEDQAPLDTMRISVRWGEAAQQEISVETLRWRQP